MIHIYKKNTEVLSLNQDVVNVDKLPATVDKQRLQKLKPEEGLWVLEQQQDSASSGLRYYRKLYTDTYSKELGFLISSYNSMIARIDELTNTVHKVELMKKEADFKMLQAQINPHFLYNTLETMRMHAEQNDDPDVAEMACSLGKLLRYSLSKSENETSLLSEIEHVEHYTAIHKVRMGSRLEVVWDISEDVASRLSTFRCPRFIVQPMVENSIQHGISKKRRKGMITISVEDTTEEVVLTIADNGVGIPPERLEIITKVLNGSLAPEDIPFTGGIGLYNVNERIKAFYGNPFGISMTSVDGEGAQCIIRLGKQM
ncbi:sensor histidine kinase [Paenibacillus monticola]|uniref:Sensor histidine kinase n=1 Tax=Paenibacillus monticola TaxID=2666075 RepID=A0A7X2L0N8_9BACL|nr:sensor histidine kinase [Paenibacillus monticola]MRN52270.1 hypothetical protein [Paenibacillus monticola]